ncbi:MAG: YkgJ family cysteine cluster protein [Sedimentisphaerales bacterium]|nr:YkgJ family cysteine cluster protein [Sedimentisphaerales bacterium]
MAVETKNTWLARTQRTVTAILPVSEKRTGECVSCGECCKLPNVCPFLRYDAQGKSYCTIYSIRPLNCRKYPRTKSEWITSDTCGFSFD